MSQGSLSLPSPPPLYLSVSVPPLCVWWRGVKENSISVAFLNFIFMYMGVLPTCICTTCVQCPWHWSYRRSYIATCVPEVWFRSSTAVAQDFNYWAVSPASIFTTFKIFFYSLKWLSSCLGFLQWHWINSTSRSQNSREDFCYSFEPLSLTTNSVRGQL